MHQTVSQNTNFIIWLLFCGFRHDCHNQTDAIPELRNSFFHFEGYFKVEITIKKQLTTPGLRNRKHNQQFYLDSSYFPVKVLSISLLDIVFERIFFLLPWCLPFEHSRTKVISVGKVIWNQTSFTKNSIEQGLCMFHL